MNYELVTGGPCRLNCQPKYCDQSCPQGGCTITCPSDNKVCQQMCGPGKQCTKEIMPPPTTPATTTVTTAPPFVPDERESLEDGVCYQFCPGGSYVLECFNSTYYIIHVLNLAVVRILFHSICKFRWVCFTESDQFALIWQFLLKNNMTQYGDIQWSNTVKDSCSLHVRTITWWNQHSPVVNRTSFFFRWKLQHDMFWPQILFVLLFRWQLLYNVLWSRYLQIWLCCWRMWNGMLCTGGSFTV